MELKKKGFPNYFRENNKHREDSINSIEIIERGMLNDKTLSLYEFIAVKVHQVCWFYY